MTQPRPNAFLQEIRKLAGADLAALPDRDLLGRFAARRDEAAFEAVVRRHGPMVLGVCRRLLGGEHDAEDAFQAVFLVLARKAGAVAWRDSVGSWLYAVAHRLAREARRKRLRREGHEAGARGEPARDPLAEISGRELLALVDEELARLPERYRGPLVLCCLEGKTGDEAARHLGCSPSTLKRRLRQARELLQGRLQRRGLTLPAAVLPALLLPSMADAGLIAVTLRAATAFARGQSVAALVSFPAVALARGLSRTWFLARLKTVAAILLVAGGQAAGAWTLAGLGHVEKHAADAEVSGADQAKPQEEARTDRFGDPLPAGAVARLGTVRWRHEDWVGPFALAPNGSAIFAVAARTVSVWEPATGKPRACFALPAALNALACAPDGKTLAVGGSDGVVHVLDAFSGKERRQFLAHAPEARDPFFGGVHGLLFVPHAGSLVSFGSDGTLRVWDPDTGKELHRLGSKELAPGPAVASPDGRLLVAVVHDRARPIRLWDVATGAEVRGLAAPGNVGTLAFAPDGKILAAVCGEHDKPGTVVRWEVASGREIGRFTGHAKGIFALAFSPRGNTLATGGYDETIRLWDLDSGKEVRTIAGLGTPVYQLACTPDGKTLISRGAENRLRLWDLASGGEVNGLDAPEWPIAAVAYAPGGKLLAVASARTIHVWNPAVPRRLHKLQGHDSIIMDMAFAADGRLLASGGQDGTLRLWDAVAGKEMHRLAASERWVDHLAIAPDGATVATWSSGDRPEEIRLWDWGTGRVLRRLPVTSETRGVLQTVARLAFAPDGKTLFACSGTHLSLLRWEVASGKELPLIGKHDGGLSRLALSSDGRTVATATLGGTVYLWETATGRPRLIVKGAGYTTTLAFSPDSRLLALGNNGSHRAYRGDKLIDRGWENRGEVRLLRLADGKILHTFTGHVGGVDTVAFSPDGKTLASGSRDTTVLLWDVTPYARAAAGLAPAVAEIDALWSELRGDAARAHRAIARLTAAPPAQVVSFLKGRLHPVAAPDGSRVAALLKQLDSPTFVERDQAMRALSSMGDAVEPALRTALAAKPSPEVRRRVEELLADLDPTRPGSERVRTGRALEVLERVGGADARDLLRELAAGEQAVWLTQEARASLRRIER
jgi:RNA polymerase sigma factor (sigma-70 family)